MGDTVIVAGISALFISCLYFYTAIKPVCSINENVLRINDEFETQKSRLRKWGKALGLLQTDPSEKRFDDEQLQQMEQALRQNVPLTNDEKILKEIWGLNIGDEGLESEHPARIPRGHRVKARQPIAPKIRWQIEDEEKFQQLVVTLTKLNNDLESFSTERPVQIINLGGAFDGQPAIVSWARGRHDIFIRGSDNRVQHTWQEQYDGPWHEFQNLGGQAYSNVSAVSWGPDRIDLFVRGAKNCVYHKFWDGVEWSPSVSGWENLGGTIVGDISSVSWGKNRIDLFARGTNNKVYHRFWDGSLWQPASEWENLDGIVVSDPKVISWGPGHLDIFVVGLGNQIFHKHCIDGSAWRPSQTEWDELDGTVMGEIVPFSWGPGHIDLFHRGPPNALHQTIFDGQWNSTTLIGGIILENPGVVAGNGKINVFVNGTDGALWYKHFDGTDWMDWISYGGTITGRPVPNPRWDIRQLVACRGGDATLRVYMK